MSGSDDRDPGPAPEPLPQLPPEVVADDQAIGEAVDEVLRRDPVAREQLAEIISYQDALRASVDPDVWQLVLHVEELSTARLADALLTVARWAFNEGVLSERGRSCDPRRA